MVNIIFSSFRMYNTDMKKPPRLWGLVPQVMHISLLLTNNWAKLNALTAAVLVISSFVLSSTGNNKIKIMLPRVSCLSHDSEIVCSEGHHILSMPFAHSENNNLLLLLLLLVLLQLENEVKRFWIPNLHRDLRHMQVGFQGLRCGFLGFFGFWGFFK